MKAPQYARLVISFALLAFTAADSLEKQKYFSTTLTHHRGNGGSRLHRMHAASRRAALFSLDVPPFGIEPETIDAGFWYGPFDIGESRNLSLLIDTGSGDLAVNPGLYTPTTESQNLNRTGVLQYGTWKQNGCGKGKLKYSAYSDKVFLAGLRAEDVTFASIARPNGSFTQFPHDGIAGMTGGTSEGKPTWFKTLCQQGQVEECRFGLALGTAGTGKQVFGGVDHNLFDGELTIPAPPGIYGWSTNIVVNDTKSLITNRTVYLFDSGTANVRKTFNITTCDGFVELLMSCIQIITSGDDARQIFEQFGIQVVERHLDGCQNKQILGYYPCDRPPTVGIQFTLANDTAGSSPVFNIEPEAFKAADNGNNNCTSIIVGEHYGPGTFSAWIVGQAWFQGKYVDMDSEGSNLGVATLKDKTGCLK